MIFSLELIGNWDILMRFVAFGVEFLIWIKLRGSFGHCVMSNCLFGCFLRLKFALS